MEEKEETGRKEHASVLISWHQRVCCLVGPKLARSERRSLRIAERWSDS